MALIARFSIRKFRYNDFTRQLCKVKTTINMVQSALISHKSKRAHIQRLKPFDYLNKKYNVWAQIFDPMIDRCDENSKIIVVEGPPAAGKSAVAAKLAEAYDMIYLPPPSFDEQYITHYGYDLRTLNDRLSPPVQLCDVEKFLTNPHHINMTMFQFNCLELKYDQYITTLLHVLSTGQGVVLNRCFYSDYVFAQAMTNAGYIRPQGLAFHLDTMRIMKLEMMKPHLFVYLDVPVDKVKEKIQKRGIPYEVNSKVFTSKYLQDLEDTYKDFLKDIETHSHVLIYDWATEDDVSTIIEDIEMLNFDFDKKDDKMADWYFSCTQEVRLKRLLFQDRLSLYNDYYRPEFTVPEMFYSPDDDHELDTMMETVPGEQYDAGYNAKMGDKNILFKTDPYTMMSMRNRPRDVEVIKEEIKKLKLNAKKY